MSAGSILQAAAEADLLARGLIAHRWYMPFGCHPTPVPLCRKQCTPDRFLALARLFHTHLFSVPLPRQQGAGAGAGGSEEEPAPARLALKLVGVVPCIFVKAFLHSCSASSAEGRTEI